MAVEATCGGGGSPSTWLAALTIGMEIESPKPKAPACFSRAEAPSRSPKAPNAVLQETVSAWVSVICPAPPHVSPWKFCSLCVVCGSASWLGAGSCDCGLKRPLLNAAAVVMTLNVEPGG